MIKHLIPNLLYFDSGNTINGEMKGRGYYFKGLFISKYKSFLIGEMRKKFNDDFSDENKKKLADEYKVINYFYEISSNATKKTYESKKEYWDARRKQTELGDIAREIKIIELRLAKLEKEKKDKEELMRTYQDNVRKLKITLKEKETQNEL